MKMMNVVFEDEVTLNHGGVVVEIRIKHDIENDRFTYDEYDAKLEEYIESDLWYDTQDECMKDAIDNLSNDYIMGCGMFFEEERFCPECGELLDDEFYCAECDRLWDDEDLD